MILSLVKTAVDERTDDLLAREAQWLRELEDVESLEGQVPRLLDEGTGADGRRYLVISIARGIGAMRGEPRGETRAFTADHARFLASLGKARFRAADFEVSGCCNWLQQSLGEVDGCLDRGTFATLRDAYHDCETALLYWTGPYVLSQGDFAPWNIRSLGSQLFVFDWGQARAEASPLDDVLHYLMIQHALRRRPVRVRYLQAAMKRAHDFAVEAYPEWTWRPRVIGALTLVYLLGVLLHRAREENGLQLARDADGAGPYPDPVVVSYWRLLSRRAQWLPD